jgi:hypothetical protein
MWASIHSASRIRPSSEIIGVTADFCKDEVTGAVLLLLLVPDDQTISLPKEDLDSIAAAIEKKEQVPREGILAEKFTHHTEKTIEAFTHVRRFCAEENAD